MKTLIIASNQKQANFIKKGLAYESLFSTTLSAQAPREQIEAALMENDGLYVFFEDPEMLEAIITQVGKLKQDMPIMVLSTDYHKNFDDLKNLKKITDFHIKPYPFRHMASEMKFAIFDVKEKIEVCSYVLRDLELDIASHQVKVGDEIVYLRNKEFLLLHYLIMNKGKVLSRNEILENVWDRNTDLLTNTVDVHISKLRKKIERGRRDKFIRTVPCLGYVLE